MLPSQRSLKEISSLSRQDESILKFIFRRRYIALSLSSFFFCRNKHSPPFFSFHLSQEYHHPGSYIRKGSLSLLTRVYTLGRLAPDYILARCLLLCSFLSPKTHPRTHDIRPPTHVTFSLVCSVFELRGRNTRTLFLYIFRRYLFYPLSPFHHSHFTSFETALRERKERGKREDREREMDKKEKKTKERESLRRLGKKT